MRRLASGVAVVLALSSVAPIAAARAAEPPPPEELTHFADSVSVALATVRTRITSPTGAPLRDLKPEQVKVQVGARAVPVVAVDYYDGSVSPTDLPDDLVTLPADRKGTYSPQQVSARGQLFLFFVEADVSNRTTTADRRAALKKLVDALKPTDLAAVVSLDNHLRLQQDFTLDRDALLQAIVRGRAGADAPELPAKPAAFSLARSWDAKKARGIDLTEPALTRIAAALDPLPGEKVVIFLSRGTGHFSPAGENLGRIIPSSELFTAIHALQAARAEVFVVDDPGTESITTRGSMAHGSLSPDTLAAAFLQTVAGSTGGTYAQWRAKDQTLDRLLLTTRGYTLVTVDLQTLASKDRSQPLKLSLVGREGVVLTPPILVVNGKGM